MQRNDKYAANNILVNFRLKSSLERLLNNKNQVSSDLLSDDEIEKKKENK